MKAMICTQYGPPEGLAWEETAKPIPKDDEVLIGVHASSVNMQNLLFVLGKPFLVRIMGTGLRKPAISIPGNDVAGRVEAVGKNVTRFQPGDEVFGDLSLNGHGAYAEYACAKEDSLALKPAGLSFGEAAGAGEAAVVALQGLRDHGQIQNGQRVLIYGASGGIGSFAVQIAKHFGAEVTGVCGTRNLDMIRSLGADHALDYTREDYSRNGRRYDLILAIPYHPLFTAWRALSLQGKYVSVGSPSWNRIFQDMLLGPMLSQKTGKRVVGGWSAKPNPEDLAFIQKLLAEGKLKTAMDKVYPLREAAQALAYYGKGHSRGKVILTGG